MTKEQEYKETKALFDKMMSEPIPRAKPKPKPLGPKAEVVELDPFPRGRRAWSPEPEPCGVGPTVTIRYDLLEEQRRTAEIARAFRRSRDPFGTGIYGHESMAEIVRRQNGED
jgi:hypothetical protein